MGGHCVKAWSSTQGAIALSSAEAEFYAMVDAVLKAKWLTTVAQEMGMQARLAQIVLGTDSAAAKSFVCRRGLGRMRHIEIRDLWLQKEVLNGRVRVVKIPGESNPADLMTKYLSADVVARRLSEMHIRKVAGNPIKREGPRRKEEKEGGAAKARWADEAEEADDEEAYKDVANWWTEVSSRKFLK